MGRLQPKSHEREKAFGQNIRWDLEGEGNNHWPEQIRKNMAKKDFRVREPHGPSRFDKRQLSGLEHQAPDQARLRHPGGKSDCDDNAKEAPTDEKRE